MEQERKASPAPESFDGSTPRRPRRVPGQFVLMALGAGILLGGLALAHRFAAAAPEPTEIPPIPAMFQGWEKPDFVLFVTGQTHGYLQPCGCSHPQYGGIVRRYNLMDWLKNEKKWTVIPIDFGEIVADKSVLERQTVLKFETNMKALEILGYTAYGLGATEMKLGLAQTLASFSAQQSTVRPIPLCLNLGGAMKKGEPFFDMGVRQYVVVDTPKAKLGLTSVVSPDVGDLDPTVKFIGNHRMLPGALKGLKTDRAEFTVLLYQGKEKEAKLAAKFCADIAKKDKEAAPVQLIIHAADEEEPPGAFGLEGASQLLTMGHKGRYVGVVGVWKKQGGGFDTRYQLVSMGEEWITPPAKVATHPIMRLMENEFAARIAKEGIAEKFPRSQHATQLQLRAKDVEARFVGSDVCSNCHPFADQVWAKTGHSHAFKTLEVAKNPSLRDRDGECIVCHSVGFMHDTGYLAPGNTAKLNKKLVNVGCESCHGPGSMHANDPDNKTYYKLINAFAKHHNEGLPEKSRMQRIDDFCQKCHDIDNDVNWGKVPFAAKWAKIAHPTPKQGANPPAAQGKQPNPPGVEGKEPEKDAPPKIVEK